MKSENFGDVSRVYEETEYLKMRHWLETEKVGSYACGAEGVLDQSKCFASGGWSIVKIYLGYV